MKRVYTTLLGVHEGPTRQFILAIDEEFAQQILTLFYHIGGCGDERQPLYITPRIAKGLGIEFRYRSEHLGRLLEDTGLKSALTS
jgi:hypothetical protein